MPLPQRVIEPVDVSRSTLPLPPGDIKPLIRSLAASTGQGLAANAAAAANINVVNELACVTNGTLANLIRQLSTLSRQAEELLSGVFTDASKLLSRTATLQQKMNSLAIKVDSLEQAGDTAIILRDPTSQQETFLSDMSYEQQILAKGQMPPSIAELYETCDKPPPLNKLDPYRDDGKDGLKFYTDPTFFFELWKKDMLKETMKAQQSQSQYQTQLRQQQIQRQNQASRTLQHPKRHSQQPPAPSQLQQYQTTKPRHAQQIVSSNGSYTSSTTYVSSVDSNQDLYGQNQSPAREAQRIGAEVDRATEAMTRHMQQATISDNQMPMYQQQASQFPRQTNVSQHPTPQYPDMSQKSSTIQQQQNGAQSITGIPQNPSQFMPDQFNQSIAQSSNSHFIAAPPPPPALSPLPPPTSPPPPPPPPPPAPPAPSQPASTPANPPPAVIQAPTAAQLQQKQQQLKKTVPVQRDPRSDLLAAIKQGITLRRVEDSKRRVEAEKQQSMGNDVASILARRVAMEVSDSDDNGEDDDEENEWDEKS